MIKKLLKGIVDLLYGTAKAKRKYEQEHPGEMVVAADGCKGIITGADQEIIQGMDWLTSQRGVILLTDKKLVCGKWTIPLTHIASAELLKINALFVSGLVLKVHTKGGEHFQFGMQLNQERTAHPPFR